MLTIPIVARCQRPFGSISATDTLKWARSRSLRLRTTWRLSFRECAPSMHSSRVRKAINSSLKRCGGTMPPQYPAGRRRYFSRLSGAQFDGDALGGEGFDHIAHLHVTVIRDRDTALHAVAHFAGVVLEAAERSDFALVHDHVVAQQADFGVALDQAVLHHATGHGTHLGDAEGIANFGAALIGFLDLRLEQAGH